MKQILVIVLACLALVAEAMPSIALQTNNTQLVADNISQIRPIASVTKLMTAIVTLESEQDLSKRLKLSHSVKSNLPPGQYTRYELLNAMLVRSDNAAAETFAENYPGGRKMFIDKMNDTATKLHMRYTHFEDPTGLGIKNISTAEDIILMLNAASEYWPITNAATKPQVVIDTATKKQPRSVVLKNTNSVILLEFDDVALSKTGYTSPAGWCVAMIVERYKQKYFVVVLGAKSKNDRIKTVENLLHNHLVDLNREIDYWKL